MASRRSVRDRPDRTMTPHRAAEWRKARQGRRRAASKEPRRRGNAGWRARWGRTPSRTTESVVRARAKDQLRTQASEKPGPPIPPTLPASAYHKAHPTGEASRSSCALAAALGVNSSSELITGGRGSCRVRRDLATRQEPRPPIRIPFRNLRDACSMETDPGVTSSEVHTRYRRNNIERRQVGPSGAPTPRRSRR